MSRSSSTLGTPWLDLDASPVAVARGLAHRPGFAWFDTSTDFSNSGAGRHSRTHERHSLIVTDPKEFVSGHLSDPGPLAAAIQKGQSARRALVRDCGLPCGGAFGFVSYDGSYTFGIYDEVLAYDHAAERWLSEGFPLERIDWDRAEKEETPELPLLKFEPDLDGPAFRQMVRRARDYIAAGDIYQVNLSQRFRARWPRGLRPFDFYEHLRRVSPAPYSALLRIGSQTLFSTSPELFLRLSGRSVRTCPIKGTRPRFRDPEADEKSAYDLLTSQKEIAELIMITDLERNDLGRICEFGSVLPMELLALERYQHVFHLVSTIDGVLRPEVAHLDALRSCFPGGSITGAPKKRAMEIIAELEPVARGPYTGAIGWIGYNEESKFNIAIRTALLEDSELSLHVGAGIVADSNPQLEYEETLHKAAGFFALGCKA